MSNIHGIEVGDWVNPYSSPYVHKVKSVDNNSYHLKRFGRRFYDERDTIILKHNAVVLTQKEVEYLSNDCVNWASPTMQNLGQRCKAALEPKQPEYPLLPFDEIHAGWKLGIDHGREIINIGCKDFSWSEYIEAADWAKECVEENLFHATFKEYSFKRVIATDITTDILHTLCYRGTNINYHAQQILAKHLRKCQEIKNG